MKARRFDNLARSLGSRLPRRGMLRGALGSAVALGLLRQGTGVAAHQGDEATGAVGLQCERCNCTGDQCDCCILGISGGGVVRTETSDVTFVLFATLLADAPQQATGFVRWIDPAEGGGTLESVGPIAYEWDEGDEHFRHVRGLMTVNGQDQQPFALEVFDAGPDQVGADTVRLTVGAKVADANASGFGYEAAGTLIGGDIQLLDNVAPVGPST
jgi:hypothetical protein